MIVLPKPLVKHGKTIARKPGKKNSPVKPDTDKKCYPKDHLILQWKGE